MNSETSRTLLPSVAGEQTTYTEALTAELASFLEAQRAILAGVSADTLPLVDALRDLTRGGKRLRALLCYWGWRGAGGGRTDTAVVRAGVALELFQAAALIHDDIIDRSDTRRGAPSVHRRFSNTHGSMGWHLDGDRFGEGAAILAGDMCLSFSEEVFAAVGPRTAHGTTARAIFNRMRTEVMAGQYLDILEEVAGPGQAPGSAVDRAMNILRYKSAKYSTEHPLMLGGALAGAPADLIDAYSDFALPLGEAFQLRDDVLGVFGDPAITGKPAGDDLREGKRTVLIAQALNLAAPAEARLITEHLGQPALTDALVGRIRNIIVESGALQATEDLITERSAAAYEALDRLTVDGLSRAALDQLAQAAIKRTA